MLKKTILKIVIILFYGFSYFGYAQEKTDSLRLIWLNEKIEDSLRFNALAEYYRLNNQANPDSTLSVLDYYYKLAIEKKSIKELYNVANDRGGIYRLKGESDTAMYFYEQAKELALKLNDSILLATNSGNMGNVFVQKKDYKKATQYFYNALKIYRNAEYTKGESHMLTSLGSVYLIIQNYDLALEHYEKALSLIKNRGYEDRRTAVIYINIGWTNFEKQQFKEAKTYYEKALKILEVTNDKFFIANCYSTLARIHLKLNELNRSKSYAEKYISISKELNQKNNIIHGEIIMAQLAYNTNIVEATKQAEVILKKMPTDIGNESKILLYELLYNCYKAQNKPSKSLEMFEIYKIYSDSIQIEKNKFAVIRETVKNEFDIKLYETKLENEKRETELKLKQQKNTFLIIFASLLLLGLVIYYYKSTLKKNRKKREELLIEIENLKNKTNNNLVVDTLAFELNRDEIEKSIHRNLNETDWKVLNVLLEKPEITNKEIADKLFLSVDGIGSSLRRMYEYFDIKDSKYKKITLISDAIRRSTT